MRRVPLPLALAGDLRSARGISGMVPSSVQGFAGNMNLGTSQAKGLSMANTAVVAGNVRAERDD
jgi:hypothetical protein